MSDLTQARTPAATDEERNRADGGGHGRKPRWGRTWGAAFVLLFGLAACWSVATPMFASPDEPTQIVRAAAVAHGEMFGEEIRGATTSVRIPAGIAHEVTDSPACYAFKPSQPAGCAPKPTSGRANGTAPMTTYVGHYPPLYYAIVGLPSLFSDQAVVLYLMRLVSAALSAAFLAAASAAAIQARRRYVLSPLGLALAVTPINLFLAGMVNPAGLEISAAICVWSTGLALAGNPEMRKSRFLIAWFAVSASVLVQTRGLSSLFLAAAVIGTLLLFGWRTWVQVLTDRLAQAGLALLAACSAFALGWFVAINPTEILPAAAGPVHQHGLSLLSTSFHHYVAMIPQMIGVFGWADTPSPQASYYIWYAVLLLVAVFALARRWWRGLGTVAFLLAATLAVPVLLMARVARQYGLVGQGRDWLPLAVSLPLVTAYAARQLGFPARRRVGAPDGAALTARWSYPVAVVVVMATLAMAAAELGGFLQALHRYRNGLGNTIDLFGSASWTPPVSPVLIVVAAVLLELLWCAWLGGSTAFGLVSIRPGARSRRTVPTVRGSTAPTWVPRS